MHVGDRQRQRPPLSPQEGWLSDGRRVLHFRPLSYNRWSQSLEVTHGELITGEPPLLKRREELQRQEAIRLWIQKRQAGWRVCEPQWSPPSAVQPPAHQAAASMGATAIRSCF
jgi:hypothetical protein